MPRAHLRRADDPRGPFATGSRLQHRVRVLLVLVAELDALRAPVELGAGEADAEVAPVVLRQGHGRSCGQGATVKPPASITAPGRRGFGGSPPASPARRRRSCPPSAPTEAAQPASSARRGRTTRGRDRPDLEQPLTSACDPARAGRQLTACRDHLRLRLDECQLLQRRPGGDGRPGRNARAGADVEQRSRRPVGPLPLHLAEHRSCRGERRRRAVRQIGGDGGAAARRARPRPRRGRQPRAVRPPPRRSRPPAPRAARSLQPAAVGARSLRLGGQRRQHVVGVGVRLHPSQLLRDVAVRRRSRRSSARRPCTSCRA